MSTNQFEAVHKYGGTSVAMMELVVDHTEHEDALVVVLSAPGLDLDAGFDAKVTEMLNTSEVDLLAVQERYRHVGRKIGLDWDYLEDLSINMGRDFSIWSQAGWPVDALGEKWAAQMFAEKTGREFVDASEIIKVDRNGELNEYLTIKAVRERLKPNGRYAIPGYYGVDKNGDIHTLTKGGSDITGAIIAKALEANEYHNWSDVPGFMTANPKIVGADNARLLDTITYLESRNLGICGAALLHIAVREILEGTGVDTIMRNTFGATGNRGTVITDQRDWEAARPVVAVSGVPAIKLHARRRLAHDQIGATKEMVDAMFENKVSFAQSGSGGDDFSYYIAAPDINAKDGKGMERYNAMAFKLGELERSLDDTTLDISLAGMLHIIGEGLMKSGRERGRAVGISTLTLGDYFGGSSDIPESPIATLFIEHTDTDVSELSPNNVEPMQQLVNQQIRAVHSALNLQN